MCLSTFFLKPQGCSVDGHPYPDQRKAKSSYRATLGHVTSRFAAGCCVSSPFSTRNTLLLKLTASKWRWWFSNRNLRNSRGPIFRGELLVSGGIQQILKTEVLTSWRSSGRVKISWIKVESYSAARFFRLEAEFLQFFPDRKCKFQEVILEKHQVMQQFTSDGFVKSRNIALNIALVFQVYATYWVICLKVFFFTMQYPQESRARIWLLFPLHCGNSPVEPTSAASGV